MNRFLFELRQAIRSILRAPAASAVIIATVGVGMAAGATVFSLVDGLMWKPLPGVADQKDLVNVHATAEDGTSFHSVSYLTYVDLRDGIPALSGLAAFSGRLVSLGTGAADPEIAVAGVVSGNFFDVLGARPAMGRFFGPAEDRVPDRDRVAVLSDRGWKRRFAADPAIVGRSILVNGHAFTVLGVAAPGFNGTFHAQPFDLWMPLMTTAVVAPGERLVRRDENWLEMVGRRAPSVSLPQAQAAFTAVGSRMAAQDPDTYRGVGYDLRPVTGFEDSLRGPATMFFGMLGALALLVLAIAGGNVSGVLLARAMAREKEMSVRLALGAARRRLAAGIVLETLLLFLAGGLLGVGLSEWTGGPISRLQLPAGIPLALDLTPGLRTLLFGVGLSAGAGILFGLLVAVPATRVGLLAALRAGFGSERRGAARLRALFVAAQMAFSVLLLVAAGLFLRTVQKAAVADPGFAIDGLTMTSLDLRILGADNPRAHGFFEALVARVASLPGVESAASAGLMPLGPGSRSTRVTNPETPDAPPTPADFVNVGHSYFETMKIPILAGRNFAETDLPDSPQVVIVNETLARRFWPGRDPIGKKLNRGDSEVTVVGVARNAKSRRLWEEPRAHVYYPTRQTSFRHGVLVVRGSNPEALAPMLREAIRSLEPALPSSPVMSVRDYAAFSLLPQRLGGAIAGALGVAGLVIAGIGLAALVAHSVARRRREIGIRLAVGARPGDVVALEMKRGLRVAAAGALTGIAAALFLARFLRGMLYGVSASDPATFAGTFLLLLAAAALAAFVPARRAARVDPMTALRSE
jgi:predicted permease